MCQRVTQQDGRPQALEKDLLASFLGVHPECTPTMPQHIRRRSSGMKRAPTPTPLLASGNAVLDSCTVRLINCIPKGVITARGKRHNLTLFNSETVKDEWECVSGPESRDEISGQETASTISSWLKAGVHVTSISDACYMNALL